MCRHVAHSCVRCRRFCAFSGFPSGANAFGEVPCDGTSQHATCVYYCYLLPSLDTVCTWRCQARRQTCSVLTYVSRTLQTLWLVVVISTHRNHNAQSACAVPLPCQRTQGYCFVQALWLVGPTAMIIASVLTVAAIAVLDHYTTPERKFIDMLQRIAAHQTEHPL